MSTEGKKPDTIPDGKHGTASGTDCQICFCEIESDGYCEYKTHDEPNWTPSVLCFDCIELMRTTQWKRFEEMVEKADCRAAMLRLCNNVPINVREASFVCSVHGDTCDKAGAISALWSSAKGDVSPVLEGAKVGEDRDKYVAHLREYAELLKADKESEIAADDK